MALRNRTKIFFLNWLVVFTRCSRCSGGCLDIFSFGCLFSHLSPSLSGRRPDIDGNTVSKGRNPKQQQEHFRGKLFFPRIRVSTIYAGYLGYILN